MASRWVGPRPAGAAVGLPGYPALPTPTTRAAGQRARSLGDPAHRSGTNNPLMVFSIDDGYAYGLNNQVEIKVTYWNHGTDRWTLSYLDSAGACRRRSPWVAADPWVQKTNSARL